MDRTLRQPVLRAPDLFGKSIQSGARIEGIRQPASERCEHPQNQKSRGTPDESPHECQSIPSRNRRFKHRCKAYPALRRLKQAISKSLGAKKISVPRRDAAGIELRFPRYRPLPFASSTPRLNLPPPLGGGKRRYGQSRTKGARSTGSAFPVWSPQ